LLQNIDQVLLGFYELLEVRSHHDVHLRLLGQVRPVSMLDGTLSLPRRRSIADLIGLHLHSGRGRKVRGNIEVHAWLQKLKLFKECRYSERHVQSSRIATYDLEQD
jgi:hypothetical protein